MGPTLWKLLQCFGGGLCACNILIMWCGYIHLQVYVNIHIYTCRQTDICIHPP